MIHEPGRLIIVALLASVEECDYSYLVHETELRSGTLSSHLVRLERAGYVQIEKTFRGKVPRTVLRLTDRGRIAFAVYRRKLKASL
jgi:DNA-binding MarR family transcriptional regulator